MHLKDEHFRIINFYETDGHANSDQSYLERFSYETLLPFSNRGYLFEHDLNYHVYSSLVIPSHMTKALQTRVTLVLEFKSFLQERSAKSSSAKEILQVLDKTVLPEIGRASGHLHRQHISGCRALRKRKSFKKDHDEVDDILDLAFMGQTSPQMHLMHLLNRPELR